MKIKNLVRPDFPNADMAFWQGFASIFDFRGNLHSRTTTLTAAGDAKAMERDWQMLGEDMRRAIERFKPK